MVFYKKGAEAELIETTFDGEKALLKKRVSKTYRDKKIDSIIRKKRTRAESKILGVLYGNVQVPKIFSIDENKGEILMEYIGGDVLKKIIEKQPKLSELAGKEIRKIHDFGIIHGDLTTSNMIVRKNKKKIKEIVFIDFGLGYFSKKLEDQATDLIVFKKTFNATHPNLKKGFDRVMKGYKPSEEILTQMARIEKRARYH